MKIHHIAFWTLDIERLVDFYCTHWQGIELFRHQSGDFHSVFIEIFGCLRIEIMSRTGLPGADPTERVGYSHLSVEVESREEVNRLTETCLAHGIRLEKNREQYDDGFYESSFLDPDGNIIEIAFVDRMVNPAV